MLRRREEKDGPASGGCGVEPHDVAPCTSYSGAFWRHRWNSNTCGPSAPPVPHLAPGALLNRSIAAITW